MHTSYVIVVDWSVAWGYSSSLEILLRGLKPFTHYKLAVRSNGVETAGPFSATVGECTLPDREYRIE